eukprot:GILK01000344.1.p1 GENE.GILK01000344.1~~GILK01000344.1.p1  ORF type:complete len:403 (+),score=56.07 GILK01000344.1:72-1280(+)
MRSYILLSVLVSLALASAYVTEFSPHDYMKESPTWHPHLQRVQLSDGNWVYEDVAQDWMNADLSFLQLQETATDAPTTTLSPRKLSCSCKFLKDNSVSLLELPRLKSVSDSIGAAQTAADQKEQKDLLVNAASSNQPMQSSGQSLDSAGNVQSASSSSPSPSSSTPIALAETSSAQHSSLQVPVSVAPPAPARVEASQYNSQQPLMNDMHMPEQHRVQMSESPRGLDPSAYSQHVHDGREYNSPPVVALPRFVSEPLMDRPRMRGAMLPDRERERERDYDTRGLYPSSASLPPPSVGPSRYYNDRQPAYEPVPRVYYPSEQDWQQPAPRFQQRPLVAYRDLPREAEGVRFRDERDRELVDDRYIPQSDIRYRGTPMREVPYYNTAPDDRHVPVPVAADRYRY